MAVAERRISTRRGAEGAIVGTLGAAAALTTHSVVAILAVGAFAQRWGERFGVGAYRRANLLDVTSCTLPFVLPYCIPPVLAAALTAGGDAPRLGPLEIGLLNTHAWALAVVVAAAVVTGYGGESRPGEAGGGDDRQEDSP